MRPFEPPRRALLAAGAIAIALASLVAVLILLEPGAPASIIEASGQVSGVEVTLSSKVPGIAEVVAVRARPARRQRVSGLCSDSTGRRQRGVRPAVVGRQSAPSHDRAAMPDARTGLRSERVCRRAAHAFRGPYRRASYDFAYSL